jgi:hypothetical protein
MYTGIYRNQHIKRCFVTVKSVFINRYDDTGYLRQRSYNFKVEKDCVKIAEKPTAFSAEKRENRVLFLAGQLG